MQNWALDPMHPVAFFDTIRIKIRNTGDVVVPKAMQIAFEAGMMALKTFCVCGSVIPKAQLFGLMFSMNSNHGESKTS